MKVMRGWIFSFTWIVFLCFSGGCARAVEEEVAYFTVEDFQNIEKIDAHVHYFSEKPAFMEQAVADNFRLVSIDTYAGPDELSIREQEQLALARKKSTPGRIVNTTAFELSGWDNPEWLDTQMSYLEESFGRGAVALKVWKNIGMEFKDKDGNFIMIDDPRFDPIFEYVTKNDITVVAHIGEPKNCWLPLDEMTVKNDRSYFTENPQYHMYLHPEFPSYEEIIKARDAMLRKYPGMKFVGCHLASLEWSLEKMEEFLEEFPESGMDLAHRIGHIQYLALEDYDAVRAFFIRYQDRLLYGSDTLPDGTEDPEEFKAQIHETWLRDWKYFATDSLMTSPYLDVEFKGLHLPRAVVEKVFRKNAEKWYPGA